MSGLSVFDYEDAKTLLSDLFASKKSRNPKFSIRGWARQLGLKGPGYLAQVLKGERKPAVELVSKICERQGWTGDERRYFELLVLREAARSLSSRTLVDEFLEAVRPSKNVASLSVDAFKLIADWYHLPIFEMLALKDFNPDAEQVARLLGGEVTAIEVEAAFLRLHRLGLIAPLENGRWKRVNLGDVRIGRDVPSRAVRAHHSQMMDRAKKALTKFPLSERQCLGSTLALQRKDLTRAWRAVQDCHDKLMKLAVYSDADSVFQFNTQLFPLTKPVRSRA